MTPAPARPRPNRTVLIVIGVIGLVGLCFLGSVLAAALPRLIHNRSKSKQPEATYTLKTLLTAEEAFRAKEGTWALLPRQLVEYANSGPQHFTCFLSPGGRWGGKKELTFEQLPAPTQARLAENEAAVAQQKQGVAVGSPVPDLVIVCAINLDDDPQLDLWSLTAGDPTPRHDADDLAP